MSRCGPCPVRPDRRIEINSSLYDIVAAYAGIGNHRTGTEVDRATREWLATQLSAKGARLSYQDYGFDRFDGRSVVVVDGNEIPSMPLYYEAVGELSTGRVGIAEFTDGEHGGGLDKTLEVMIDAAKSGGFEALVIATRGATDGLIAINCEPGLRARLPVILVAGRYAEALKGGDVEVEYSACLRPGSSSNLVGHWGPATAPVSLIITTPMSGWFSCAGERGTGIAIALQIAEYLSSKQPRLAFQIVLPSGHELGFYGAYRLAETVTRAPAAVLHLGSCIANSGSQLQAIIHADRSTSEAIKNALMPICAAPEYPENPLNPGCWVGESKCWAKFGMPMISVAGMAPLFHTPEDIAEHATTPMLLEQAADCLTRAALALIPELPDKK